MKQDHPNWPNLERMERSQYNLETRQFANSLNTTKSINSEKMRIPEY